MPHRECSFRLPGSALLLPALLAGLSLSCSTDTPLGSRGAVAFSVLPVGTSETRVASNLSAPTAMALAPDGRIFVAEQCGTLRVIKNGASLPTPAITLPVDCTGERGLLGVAIDPDFTTNQRIYLYYTVLLAPVHNRISQFTLTGDLAGGEQVLLDLDDLGTADFHNGGALHFARDGTLFIAVGDNGTGSNSQSLTTTFGKMLRINVDGSVPADNPFFNSTSGRYRTIWAMGFRNPFTFAFQPRTGRLFINDVGETAIEEIDEGVAGANYGWPTCEGPCTPSKSAFKDPFYSYTHTNGCAITGGTFYNPSSTRFPSSYIGKYMFADYCGGYINVLDPVSRTASSFSSGMTAPVDLQVSSDGGLYYLQRGATATTGELWRVDGTTNQAPIITVQPANVLVSVGQPAGFSVSATGTAPITYQWQRDGAPITGATSPTYSLTTTTMADSGAVFRCVVTNDFSSVTSGSAVLSVTTNQPPSAVFTSPAIDLKYKGGQTITYSATATDPETGDLAPSGYSWQVVFHHDSHIHPFIAPTSGSTSGSFDVPTIGEKSANVYFAILLTVTDPAGLSQTFERDVFPLTSTISLQSTPTTAQVTLDGQPVTTPYSVLGVAGVQRTLGTVSPQTIGGASYSFSSWSDSGTATHTISTPDTSSTYTAAFTSAPPPSADVTFVQANANTGISVPSLAVPLPSATSGGNLIVVGIDWGTATFGDITDSQGNTFTQVGTQQVTPGGVKSRFYYARNIKGGPETVTISMSGADPSLQVYVAEYRGADPTNPLDVTSQRTGTAGSVTSGAVTTTSINDVLVGFCVSDGTCSVPSGWNARSTHSNNLLEDRAQATLASVAATASSNNGWSMVLAAFRPTQGAVAPVASVTVAGPTSVQIGQTIQLSATMRDAAGNVLNGRNVTWSSGSPAIATVSNTGLVTGVSAGGPVTIIAVSEGVTGNLGVTVTEPPPPSPVTASVTAADKVFDGTTTATITSCTLSSSPAGVSCAAAAASFSDASVGTGKTVTATGITLSGPNAASYVLTSTTATTTASILAAPPPSTNVIFAQANAATGVSASSLTVSLPAPTNAASLIVVGVDWATATFGSITDGQGNGFTQVGTQQATPGGVKSRFYYAKNIRGGTEAVTVTMSGTDPSLQVYVAEYRGADITNPLDVTSQRTGTSGSVTSGAVTTTSTNDQLVGYCVSDGTCTVASGWVARSTHSNNLLEDKTQATTASVAATASSNNGWSMVLAAFRPQQTPPAPVATVNVSPATSSILQGRTVQLSATTLDASGATLTGRTITWSSADPSVATVSATGLVTGLAAGGPVTITATSEGVNGTAQVTVTVPPPPTPVTASVTAANKVYDGTAAATITSCALSDSPSGVTCSAASASFTDATVGTGKTVTATGITLGGANAGSYVLTSTSATTTADILPPIQVTASVTAANKVFDGTTTATITSCTLSGSPSGVTCSAAAANFSDASVGANKTVTASGITLGGANAVSYALTSTTATTTASILAVPTNVSFVQANARSVNARSNALSLPAATTTGNLLVVGIAWSGGSSLRSITDNQGNSWTQIGTQASTSNSTKTRLYYARNIKGGSTTITVTLSGNSSSFQVYGVEYRGASTTNPLDVMAQRTGSSGSVTSGTAVTTSANDQVVGFCVSDGTCSAGSDFTARLTNNNRLVEDRTQATAGSVAATGSATRSWVMIMAAFRPQ